MTIAELVAESYRISAEHGFHAGEATQEERERVLPTKLALIHSEVSEALEHFRDGNMGAQLNEIVFHSAKPDKPDGFAVELADIVIRVADLAAMFNIDLEKCIARKAAYNATRPRMHGGKKC